MVPRPYLLQPEENRPTAMHPTAAPIIGQTNFGNTNISDAIAILRPKHHPEGSVSQVIVDQNNLDPLFRQRFFGNRPGIAQTIMPLTVHTDTGFHTRGLLIETPGVHRCGQVLDQAHRRFQIRNDFIPTDRHHHRGPKINAAAPFPVLSRLTRWPDYVTALAPVRYKST